MPSEFDYGREAKKPRLSSENRLERRRHEEVSILQYSIYFHFRCINMSLSNLIHTAICPPTLMLVYYYRLNEDLSS